VSGEIRSLFVDSNFHNSRHVLTRDLSGGEGGYASVRAGSVKPDPHLAGAHEEGRFQSPNRREGRRGALTQAHHGYRTGLPDAMGDVRLRFTIATCTM